MLRKSCAATLEWIAGFVAEPLTFTELKDWCCRAYREFADPGFADGAGSDTCPNDEAGRIVALAQQLFAESITGDLQRSDANGRHDDLDAGRQWLQRVGAEGKFPAGPCPKRFGFLLNALDEAGEVPPAIREQLLRHVEVRRNDCLDRWESPNAEGTTDPDDERLAVTVFLFRAAMRQGDLRFLNAGLKMFDWFGAPRLDRWRRLASTSRSRILLAAMEAVTAIELLVPT